MVAAYPQRRQTRAWRTCARWFIAGILWFCASASLHAQPAALSTADRILLAEYRALGRAKVPLLLATAPESTRAVATALGKRGSEVIGRRDTIGYLYAFVPLDSMPEILATEGVQAVQIAANPVRGDMAHSEDAAVSATSRTPRLKGAAPSAALGADNPYTSEAATQALSFKERFPQFDGRGVTTAFVEPVAPNMETMRGALDLAGRPLPKFASYELMVTARAEDAVAGREIDLFVWQKTEQVEPREDGTFTWRGREYRLPASVHGHGRRSVEWRMCRRLKNFFMEDQDILWARNLDRVWALAAQAGGDFSKARSASLREPVSWIAVDRRAAMEGESTASALVFSADRSRGWLAVTPTAAGHGGMVGSVMAGAGFMGSRANGIAPAAQISIFLAARPVAAQSFDGLEQMLQMISDPRVDVAQSSQVVGDTSRFGASSIHSLWANRLIEANGKPFVKGAGNFGPRLFGSNELEQAASVFAVGAYTPRASWRANLGIEPAGEHVLASYSGWGPAADGGLKPDFLALTHTLSEGGLSPWYWGANGDIRDYAVSGGTSAAGPHGAGHIALLVSAARQKKIAHDAFRLRAAIATTAKFLEGVHARAQGHGLIQVSDAWEALQRANKWKPPLFDVRAPLVGQESTPDGPPRFVGRGLFELSGWKPGDSGRREITITRRSGAARASRFLLRWKGDIDVFSSQMREVELPLGQAVSIAVDVRVGAAGSYSAILDLIDASVQLVAGSVLNTVIVADRLVPDGEGLRYDQGSPRPGSSQFFVEVPSGLASLTVALSKDQGKSWWAAIDPIGRTLPFRPYGSELFRFDESELTRTDPHFTYANPVPGVWQFVMLNVEPGSMADLEAVDWSRPMPLKVHIQGWSGADSKPGVVRASHAVETTLRATPDVTDAHVEPLGVGAARETSISLSAGLQPTFFDVTVAPGSTSLTVQVEHAHAKARVGLYVFKAPEGGRVSSTLDSDDTMLMYYDTSWTQQKRFTLETPPPGRYRIALDPIDVPGERIDVTYREVVHHPVFGVVSLKRESNGSTTALVEAHARPADGRRLYAEMGLFKRGGPDTRALLGRQGWFVEP
jgi:subtilisin family serine protease